MGLSAWLIGIDSIHRNVPEDTIGHLRLDLKHFCEDLFEEFSLLLADISLGASLYRRDGVPYIRPSE